ncbi:UvrD-helicase domain-containing protein [Thermogemmatispora sp.]|uniref:UvrD-helicase domain-containing protein n=1 Tax=Thermogemmatispora sp. TaxID=1968838 RepID=UPI001DA79B03|nr:UvrD-helicase domain-containing protein [Thermogemmatispora sp.]MBX5449938.1 AAA family ATPase [Thermogemmatispora sp.]
MAAGDWYLLQKPEFVRALQTLSPKEIRLVVEKLNLLLQDPSPDGHTRCQVRHMGLPLYRLRCGAYRIFYRLERPYICVLALRRRNQATYSGELDAALPEGALTAPLVADDEADEAAASGGPQPETAPSYWERWLAPQPPPRRPLPEPITPELLRLLGIPAEFHARLLPIQTQEDLLDCPGVPDEYLLLIDQHMFERPLVAVLQQPDYLLGDVEDLLRYRQGELAGFLLRLSPEQESYVARGLRSGGPTLLKGGPGTGKSTIALYRVRAVQEELRRQGRPEARLLLTTYTNALVRSCEQLLRQLPGVDLRFVEVQTADRLIYQLLDAQGEPPRPLTASEEQQLFEEALEWALLKRSEGGPASLSQLLERLGREYLRRELTQVIMARQITSLEEYLEAPRPGRRVALSPQQRRAVWVLYEAFVALLRQQGRETWQQVRARAAAWACAGRLSPCYDAVIIDEAQDLDPAALRLLVLLCRDPRLLFITADANQSIYGSGFAWTEVHQWLRFRGRTSVLTVNYRSTREIGEAARAYLRAQASAELDGEPCERRYEHSGPVPALRRVASRAEEVDLLRRFLPAAAHELRLGIGACAVLTPTLRAGQRLAEELRAQGVPARFMRGPELDLQASGVKVLTLQSAKGLEFPVVALAGFTEGGWHQGALAALSEEERQELLAIDRRTLFVGMTRAMRALLVIVPQASVSPLLEGFDSTYWNVA